VSDERDLQVPQEYFRKELPDGRAVIVFPLVFGRARVGVVNANCSKILDDVW